MGNGRNFTLFLVLLQKKIIFLIFQIETRVNLADRQTDRIMMALKANLFAKCPSVRALVIE